MAGAFGKDKLANEIVTWIRSADVKKAFFQAIESIVLNTPTTTEKLSEMSVVYDILKNV